jgi:hypothetical protein
MRFGGRFFFRQEPLCEHGTDVPPGALDKTGRRGQRQKRADDSSIVELSLNTNLIRFKSERQDDGTVKLFVLPEDESRAREIVRV